MFENRPDKKYNMHLEKKVFSLNQKYNILCFFLVVLFLSSSFVSAREVTLSWDENNEPDLDHYIVYWGIEQGNYDENSGNIGLVTEFSVEIPDDDQVYFFAVTAVDEAGLESDFSNEVSTGVVKLLSFESSWNLISVPTSQDAVSIEEILGPIMDDIISVWAYVEGSWQVYDPENPSFSDLVELDSGTGIWVNMKGGATLAVQDAGSDGIIFLTNGWNLVGVNSSDVLSVTEAISQISENVLSVWSYEDGQWKIYDPLNPGFSDLSAMKPGFGYWINVKNTCIWTR